LKENKEIKQALKGPMRRTKKRADEGKGRAYKPSKVGQKETKKYGA